MQYRLYTTTSTDYICHSHDIICNVTPTITNEFLCTYNESTNAPASRPNPTQLELVLCGCVLLVQYKALITRKKPLISQLMPGNAPWGRGPGRLKAGTYECVCVCACRLVCQIGSHSPVCSTQSIKSAFSLMRTVPGTNACPGVRIHNWEELGEFISIITKGTVRDISPISFQILSLKRSKQPLHSLYLHRSLGSNITQYWYKIW